MSVLTLYLVEKTTKVHTQKSQADPIEEKL